LAETSAIRRLKEMTLVEADKTFDSVGLRFDGAIIRAFMAFSASLSIPALVGLSVVSVEVVPSPYLAINFSGGHLVRISLDSTEYTATDFVSGWFP